MKRVFICSPYAGDVQNHVAIAEHLCWEAVARGFAPFAPHLFYTQFLDDINAEEREAGLRCGLAFLEMCDEVWAYTRNGISKGMRRELRHAKKMDIPIIEIGGSRKRL